MYQYIAICESHCDSQWQRGFRVVEFLKCMVCFYEPLNFFQLVLDIPARSTEMPDRTSLVFSQAQQFRAKRSDVDCGSKICFLTHAVIENCFVYMETNQTDCQIPCRLSGCRKELHHFIDCPIWRCFEVVTTTTFSTTTTKQTTTSTLTPKPSNTTTTLPTTTSAFTTTTPFTESPSTLSPLPPLDHPAYLYSSVALNILFFLILWTILIQKCKKCISRRIRRFQNRNNSNNTEQAPIIRAQGNARQSRSQRRPESRNDGYLSIDLSSSEDFDTREHLPLLRTATAETSFSRVPSFLNSPILPQCENRPPSSSSRRSSRRSRSIAISTRQRSSLFDSDQPSQSGQARGTRTNATRQTTGTGLFGSIGSEIDTAARSMPTAGSSTFKPNPRQTRTDNSWRKDLEQESRM